MALEALVGNDDIILQNIPLANFAGATRGSLDVPNDLVALDTGVDGNTIYALNTTGKNATLTVNILMGSADDRRLNGLIPDLSSFESTVTITGNIIKKVGDGQGNIKYITYCLSGGIVSKIPQVTSQVQGQTEQGIVEYKIVFANTDRAIV